MKRRKLSRDLRAAWPYADAVTRRRIMSISILFYYLKRCEAEYIVKIRIKLHVERIVRLNDQPYVIYSQDIWFLLATAMF